MLTPTDHPDPVSPPRSDMRFAVALVVAVILGVVGLSIFASTGSAAATVYQTDAHGPKITLDGKPQMTRAPSFRLLVGTDRKTAKWVDVNALQYAGCSVGNRWSGSLCRKFTAPTVSAKTVALLLIGIGMFVTPMVAGAVQPKVKVAR